MQAEFLAHVRSENGRVIAHSLPAHLDAVAHLAAGFAAAFGAAPWGELAGRWHDLGKFRAGFQRYIRQSGDADAHIEGRVASADKTHSAAGALWAQAHLAAVDRRAGPVIARVLAYLIAGHHSGLADWSGDNHSLHNRFARSETQQELLDTLAAGPPPELLHPPPASLPSLDDLLRYRDRDIPGRFALWLRMLFSCLVDADFLDTECFMAPEKGQRRSGFLSLEEMHARLLDHLERLAQTVNERGEAASTVNQRRTYVLHACLERANCPPGVFRLSVPTGGGKTLSSLAFALRHASVHGKRRIVFAIPYTSIIEQTAEVFRDIFGDENVVEHHSSLDPDPRQETHRSRLACENWDAPLIVTTNVQLLESLFAHRTGRCRKLHNLVGSVVILDEAQLLPVHYLQPVVDVLRLLVFDYGVTLLLCTATQPTLEMPASFDLARSLRGFAAGEVREIIDDVPALYAALTRVCVQRPANLQQRCTWPELAREIAAHEAVLTIVGRRQDARELHGELAQCSGRDGLWHLSGLMCARHRSDTIGAIRHALAHRRRALAEGEPAPPVRVVSTQLVEAGVDLDFPVVYRALAGLDSIAQAAGRCNREGRLQLGEVHVFVPPTAAPPGLLRMAEQATRLVWSTLPADADPLAVDLFADYFRRLYGDAQLDAHGICDLLRVAAGAEVNFRTAAEKFRLIDPDEGATVFVRYRRDADDQQVDALLHKLLHDGPERWLLRKLQTYGVTIYQHDLHRLLASGDVLALPGDCAGLYMQSPDNDLFYDPTLGANLCGAPGDPGGLVC
ncbi:MAG: CRISPR-associated endonuclease Cas3'' [Candidatus Accumulibacter sp.]|uniref:CRISPR-associated endonuclease Cas3'' n=1 Tax=Accumulibacter sp. TaxID=2053492 RepID=UPI0028792867|nr:CRISPR-associated endonuclease Cas3'' [Accumulibacter sp.]MDS4015613.1 CRISPR-associated endonuclease Cas3'' [Accumulibacter sp.]